MKYVAIVQQVWSSAQIVGVNLWEVKTKMVGRRRRRGKSSWARNERKAEEEMVREKKSNVES